MYTGIDIVEISRMENMICKHERSLNRFFTAQELAYCFERGMARASSLAGIFAAKEAFFKIMGTGFRRGKWTDVEIIHDEWGAPIYNITGEYATWAAERFTAMPALSISHDGGYAIAMAVAGGTV